MSMHTTNFTNWDDYVEAYGSLMSLGVPFFYINVGDLSIRVDPNAMEKDEYQIAVDRLKEYEERT